MTDETAYQRMRREAEEAKSSAPAPSPGRRRFAPEVAKARAAERGRREVEARRRTLMVLAARHPDEYEQIKRDERAGIDAEKGPLPGDEES